MTPPVDEYEKASGDMSARLFDGGGNADVEAEIAISANSIPDGDMGDAGEVRDAEDCSTDTPDDAVGVVVADARGLETRAKGAMVGRGGIDAAAADDDAAEDDADDDGRESVEAGRAARGKVGADAE